MLGIGCDAPYLNTAVPRGTTYYSGQCILRPLVQPEKYGLKIKVVLKWEDTYIENVSSVTDGRS